MGNSRLWGNVFPKLRGESHEALLTNLWGTPLPQGTQGAILLRRTQCEGPLCGGGSDGQWGLGGATVIVLVSLLLCVLGKFREPMSASIHTDRATCRR